MKKPGLILTVILLFTVNAVFAQSLQTVYKQSVINLKPVTDYAANDWDQVFRDWNSSSGKSKVVAIAPDGSVFMSNKYRYSISKFDANGKYVKDFGKKGGKLASDFIYDPTIQGVLDGKYIYTSAVDGRMHFFDLNGKWVKTIRLDYMPLGTQPMKNGKIAILGHVTMGNGSKHILSIFDTNTRKQKTISSFTESYAKENESRIVIQPIEYTDKNGIKQKGPTIGCSLPYSDPFTSREKLGTDSKGNLIVGYPVTGKIAIYSSEGIKIKEFQVDMPHPAISKEEMEGFYQNMEKQLLEASKKINADDEYRKQYIAQYRSQLEKYRNPANYPANYPYFAELIVDSDDNILLLRFTKEKGSNKFDVFTYNNNGNKIGTTSFLSDDYTLNFNPNVFKFHKGQIIAYQEMKNKQGNNMRLVKFNLK